MSLTPSTMLPLGTKAPDFTLTDSISGNSLSLSALKSNVATVIMFICNHCPYVIHLQDAIVQLAKDYHANNISFIAINSNNVEKYPDDSPENMKSIAETKGYPFPYLFDSTQAIAKAYDAACTPDFYVFDKNLSLKYRGQFDGSRPGNNKPITGKDIRDALDAIIAGKPVSEQQKPSTGCNIKWK